MKTLLATLFISAAVLFSPPCRADSGKASEEVRQQARKLLEFHFGKDDRMSIGEEVKELPSIRNPADSSQKFQVLEVWGYIYKGKYRMRFTYYRSDGGSTLVGQEILEFAKL